MNESAVYLHELMESDQGWGRHQGRAVYQRLLNAVENHPGRVTFCISLSGVARVDVSFASETVVELARRYQGKKGFCLVDLRDRDMEENWDAAAARKEVALMTWNGDGRPHLLGLKPTSGTLSAFKYALEAGMVRASSFAAKEGISLQNASMKFKKLWEQGFLLRREEAAESGGLEFVYYPIR